MNILGVGALVAAMVVATQGGETVTAEQVEKRCVDARASIVRGDLRFIVKQLLSEGQPGQYENSWIIRFDGDLYRFERETSIKGVVRNRWIGAFTTGKHSGLLTYDFPVNPDMGELVASLSLKDDKSRRKIHAVDPRVVGMYANAFGLLRNQHMTSVVLSSPRTDPVLSSAEKNGRTYHVVRFSKKGRVPGDMEVWIDPVENYSINRIAYSRKEDKEPVEATLDVANKQHGPNKVWYPSRTEYKLSVKGVPTTHEIVEVKVNSLNEALPADAFTLEGIGLPEGTAVVDNRSSKPQTFYVKGNKVETRIPYQGPTPKRIDEAPPARNTFAALAGGFAAVAVALLLAFWWLRRRGKTSDGM